MRDREELRNAMLIEFDCVPLMNGDRKANRKREERKRTAEKTFLAFRTILPYATSKEQAIEMVQERFVMGLNPIVAWFAWIVIKKLAEAITAWLWDQYEEQS